MATSLRSFPPATVRAWGQGGPLREKSFPAATVRAWGQRGVFEREERSLSLAPWFQFLLDFAAT